MRLVVDTNLFVSAAINGRSRAQLDRVLLNPDFIILVDATLLAELTEVIHRPKFKRYLTDSQITTFLDLLAERCLVVYTTSTVKASPDPKDDFLLALCLDNHADYLLTGNKVDLLALRQFGVTRILTLAEFLVQHPDVA